MVRELGISDEHMEFFEKQLHEWGVEQFNPKPFGKTKGVKMKAVKYKDELGEVYILTRGSIIQEYSNSELLISTRSLKNAAWLRSNGSNTKFEWKGGDCDDADGIMEFRTPKAILEKFLKFDGYKRRPQRNGKQLKKIADIYGYHSLTPCNMNLKIGMSKYQQNGI